MQSPKVQEHFQKLAMLTKDLDPAAVQNFIAEEYAFWAPLAKAMPGCGCNNCANFGEKHHGRRHHARADDKPKLAGAAAHARGSE